MEEKVKKTLIRCAIYTRKSTSEGLDQDFTSLDAQRESAENFIKSQKSEGWQILPSRYDDGGFTGANIDRPALKKLIDDIKDGQVDCAVVYKVDRLSRSLLDFVQLLEFFEKNNVAFVSVTQAFNTNTSMGRLTLNILLSFAQFEREIISERTRDKMAAARKKGKWLGGRPILGYDINGDKRSLIVNLKEAKLVREIFELYIKERSLLTVAKILNKRGTLTKRCITKAGKILGGIPFKNTQVHFTIRNILYTGKVCYKGELYDGEHEAIIDEELFNKAQDILAENKIERKPSNNEKAPGLLKDILHCKACDTVMFHTYTSKGNVKYRYYVCMHAQKHGYETCPTRSVSAPAIEDAVVECLRKIANNPQEQKENVESLNKQLNEEIKSNVAQQGEINNQIRSLMDKIGKAKESLKIKAGSSKASESELSRLKEKLQDKEKLLSEARIKKLQLEEKLLTQQELKDALLVNTPIWDTLFPQEKRRIFKLILKQVDYDARNDKLGLTLNEKGIKFLNLLLDPNKQKGLANE